MFVSALRWIVALPAGAAAAFVAHMGLGFMFSMGHGFETIANFWDSPDMAGMPVSGTYILLVSRVLTGMALMYAIIAIVPNNKKPIAVALTSIFMAILIGFLVFLAVAARDSGYEMTFGFWYRTILDAVSSGLGMVFGASAGLNRDANRVRVDPLKS